MNLSALGREPVRPDLPVGVDVRYDPVFDLLQAEMDKASSPSVAGTVDWELTVKLAADILLHKSKDLLVGAYLAVGLIHTRGLDGLQVALGILGDMLEHHGDEIFPQRERARLRAIEWLLEKSEVALTPFENTPVAAEQLAALDENLEKLGKSLQRISSAPPSLRVLQDFFRTAGQQPAQDSVIHDEPSAEESNPGRKNEAGPAGDWEIAGRTLTMPPQTPGSFQRDNSAQREPASTAKERVTVEEALQGLRVAATVLLDQNITDPIPYRFSRQAVWLSVAELPGSNGGRTLLPSPSETLKSRLINLRQSDDKTCFLKQSEAQLSQFIFWLDLNRWADEVLAELGAARAAEAVREETAFLLQRLPGLEELAFADGTPFADDETRRWLAQLKRFASPARCRAAQKENLLASPGPPTKTDEELVSDIEVEAARTLIAMLHRIARLDAAK